MQNRILIGAGVGIAVGFLGLAAFGAYFGYYEGTAAGVPPGAAAAWSGAFQCAFALSWVAVVVGGGLGALAGLGTWQARSKSGDRREQFARDVERDRRAGAMLNRILIGAAAGIAALELALAAWGGYDGFVNGGNAGRPPGLDAAWRAALYCAVVFSYAAVPVGAAIGALAGLGSWLVRPRTAPRRR